MSYKHSPKDEEIQYRYVDTPSEVAGCLIQELGLPESAIEGLQQVVKAASDKEGRVGPLALPGSGMREAHSTGTEQLNRLLAGFDWKFVKDGHLRYFLNLEKNVVVLYQNVNEACNRANPPKNISHRGIETERLLFTPSNFTFPIFKPDVWFLCASFQDGNLKAELSKPLPFKGQFSGFSTRLTIHNQDEPSLTTSRTPIDNSFEEELGDFELPFL